MKCVIAVFLYRKVHFYILNVVAKGTNYNNGKILKILCQFF